jgi:predicted esterase
MSCLLVMLRSFLNKYIFLLRALFTLSLTTISAAAWSIASEPMLAEAFEITSKDGKTKITGEIDFRGDKTQTRTVVILVHGTGPGHRDYLMQDALAEAAQFTIKHAMFLTLAESLTKEGYAVVRFDTRGVRCSQLSCADCKDRPQPKRWGELCVDNAIRLTASLAATIEDIQSVYEYAIKRPMVKKNEVAFITHSAGGQYLAPLIQRGVIQPKLVINVAGLAEDPQAAFFWQNSIRHIQQAKKCDQNEDDQCVISPMIRAQTMDILAIGAGQVKISDLETTWLAKRTLELKQHLEALNAHDSDERKKPTPLVVGAVVGPVSLFVDTANDKIPVVERYADMVGTLIFYWGEKDVAVDANRQQQAAKNISKRPKNFLVRKFPNLGHSLGTDALIGPMDDSVLPILLKDLREAFPL